MCRSDCRYGRLETVRELSSGLAVLLVALLCSAPVEAEAAGPAGLMTAKGPALAPRDPACDACVCALRPGDELWVVTTRGLGVPHCPSLREPGVRRYTGEHGWSNVSFSELCAAPPLMTVVYLHGNRFTFADSLESGWTIYQLLTHCDTAAPLRLVVWSWPSEQVSGPVRDARVKSDRAYYEGYYLAWYLGRVAEPGPTSLVGYSFGARIVVAALDGLQRGHVDGIPLPAEVQPIAVPVRVALLAAAVDHDALHPRGKYPAALDLVDELLVTYNLSDPALRRYNLLERRRFERAMGAVGIPDYLLPPGNGIRVRQLDARGMVGRSHDEDRYYGSPRLAEALRRNLLWYAAP